MTPNCGCPRHGIRSSWLSHDWLLRSILRPLNARAALLLSTLSQEQVEEVLIGHTQFRRESLEVGHGDRIQAKGYLALELLA